MFTTEAVSVGVFGLKEIIASGFQCPLLRSLRKWGKTRKIHHDIPGK